ncbi:hypothetical protein GCM10008957_23670 [Deinococcus ruber]|uniref:Uncharacterized protein n=1 Tax=Deinococcus ruber TaxID=1848197 RepID=A0A918C9E5_9DEIO|nr:hypothetical protein GCM10008957_23670 [Deinococcus ruber]
MQDTAQGQQIGMRLEVRNLCKGTLQLTEEEGRCREFKEEVRGRHGVTLEGRVVVFVGGVACPPPGLASFLHAVVCEYRSVAGRAALCR